MLNLFKMFRSSVITENSKVYIGMSGGVDSSVTAMLLRDAGYDVTGVFIQTWQPDYIRCTWKEDRLDAMRVCSELGIRFETLDLSNEYKRSVIDYFLSEYKSNRTPNPDVMGNKHMNFGEFLGYARSCGARIATGHYARISNGELYSAVDDTKDQSYFLYQIRSEDLSDILFPLANMTKLKVRDLAKKNNLWVSDKKDSQGICMLGGEIDVKEFLKRELHTKQGNVLDEYGTAIGTHAGVELYTIGERHGFVIDKNENKTPYYIIKKNLENNTLIVSENRPEQISSGCILNLREVNILTRDLNDFATTVLARSKYRGELFEVKYDIDTRSIKVISNENVICTAGQSLVMYNAEGKVLGGGIIV